MTKQYKLPKESTERWIAALRSGGYKQTTTAYKLFDSYTGCYCADGVYAKVNNYTFNITGTTAFNEQGEGIYSDELYPLMKDVYILNDHEKLTFPQIADWIEANVEFTGSEAQNV